MVDYAKDGGGKRESRRCQELVFRSVHLRYGANGRATKETAELWGWLRGIPGRPSAFGRQVRELAISGEIDIDNYEKHVANQDNLWIAMEHIGKELDMPSQLAVLSYVQIPMVTFARRVH